MSFKSHGTFSAMRSRGSGRLNHAKGSDYTVRRPACPLPSVEVSTRHCKMPVRERRRSSCPSYGRSANELGNRDVRRHCGISSRSLRDGRTILSWSHYRTGRDTTSTERCRARHCMGMPRIRRFMDAWHRTVPREGRRRDERSNGGDRTRARWRGAMRSGSGRDPVRSRYWRAPLRRLRKNGGAASAELSSRRRGTLFARNGAFRGTAAVESNARIPVALWSRGSLYADSRSGRQNSRRTAYARDACFAQTPPHAFSEHAAARMSGSVRGNVSRKRDP